MATYIEQGIVWLRQVEGRATPNAGELVVYWPFVDLSDFVVDSEIARNGEYISKCASGEIEFAELNWID